MNGHAEFDFTPTESTDVRLNFQFSNAHFQSFVADMTENPGNKLEGFLSGSLTITNLNTADWKSWFGYGHMDLMDGFLWDIPMFGVFTPTLNKMVPNLNYTRFSRGQATYIVTNSIIYSDNMVVRSPAFQLNYDGTCDFSGHLNSRMTASFFKESSLFGKTMNYLLTPLTKAMEYKITGTLKEPVIHTVYIPSWLWAPFHPIRTFNELFGNDPDKPEKIEKP
jgi:hypothetical protein